MDGVAKSAARQITAGFFEQDQSAVHALENGTALAHALSSAFPWTCPAAAQVLLDAVVMSDLAQDPSATLHITTQETQNIRQFAGSRTSVLRASFQN